MQSLKFILILFYRQMALLFLNPWPFAICSSTRVNVESYASHNNLNDLITWDNYMINLKRLVMCKFNKRGNSLGDLRH